MVSAAIAAALHYRLVGVTDQNGKKSVSSCKVLFSLKIAHWKDLTVSLHSGDYLLFIDGPPGSH